MNTKLTSSGSQTLPFAWEFKLPVSYGALTLPPMIAGDRLVCATSSKIFALDLYSGVVLDSDDGFPHRLQPAFDPTPPLTHTRGLAYFVDNRKLIALQLSDGQPPTRHGQNGPEARWKIPSLGRVVSVNASDDVVVVVEASPDTRVKGFNALTGEILWEQKSISQRSPGPIETTREALVFVSAGNLFAVNIRSGDKRFEFIPTADSLSHVNPPQVGELKDKSIVVVSGTATYGVDLNNGTQLWTHKATNPSPNTQWLTPAISERYNRVVIGNNNNEVFVLELSTGALQWSAQIPNLAQVRIVGDKVYAGGLGRNANLQVFELMTKPREKCYEVNFDDVGRFGFIIGHGILISASLNEIRAIPFGSQNAALFNGNPSRITIDAEESQFDFQQNDFTIESWINTTCGGEIISGFPTLSGNQHHGFRVNVSEQGRVRFAIINKDARSSFAASSAMTNVADGSWHHVAVVRRGEKVETYVDGVSVEVDTDLRGSGELNISGENSLNIGAFVPGNTARPQAYFKGLMRELRIWDIALDAAKLQSRMQRALAGTEPHLLGYWRMDEDHISKLTNHVPRHHYLARPQESMRTFITELALDKSAFPYLLDQVKLQWPYAGHWSARGDNAISTTPALERNGVLAFGAGNALYGVYSSDGSRAWSRSTPAGVSAPVAGRGCFYALSGTEGVVSIDSVTGALTRVEGFDGFMGVPISSGTRLPAPAFGGRYIAAALPNGTVWIVGDPAAPGEKRKPWEWKANAPIKGDLSIVDERVYVVAGDALFQVDPASKTANSVAVAGLPVVAHGDTVFCLTAAGTVAALATSDLKKKRPSYSVSGGSITGLAASSDLDLVVVATDKGELTGLSFANLAWRWSTTIPTESATSPNRLHTPVISGRSVFCTSTSGAVAAVDAHTGEFRSLFFEPAAGNNSPVVDAGTIYFGCDEAPPAAKLLDGALHSVVFGQTHVLRLGVDRQGRREQQPAYASITSGALLELLGVDSCCVETWVNTQEGGEILSIAPTAESRYGLRLWLDRDGKINFNCVDAHDEAGANWHRLSSSAISGACDGKWHHIAVSRIGAEDVVIYLDGVALTTTKKLEPITKPALSPGLKVFIGADATAATPANFFAGMIGEIRVWDTYLTATRISERMHDKLLGNEPDLLAYWNFDRLSIFDATRFGHDGKLETGGGSSGYWLTDLNFTHPAYPSIETVGRILQERTPDGSSSVYQITVSARKADNTPLADHELTLWYVRHKGETGPDTIQISAGAGSTQLKAVKSDHGAEDSFKTKTGANGKAVFTITTSQVGHGPSLDVRPAFVPLNERYHVNVLLDTQKLEKPAPPKLQAQAQLTQDYHWETGDKVDHTRDRATWRAVIAARDSDGRARPGERLQLWATEHVEVEVNGRVYPINPNNYQSFVADHKGELTVTLTADELRAPALSVWAGFMHRDERYTIPLDEEAHKDLSEIDAEDLSEKRMTTWKPDYDAAKDGQAIIKDPGYKPHAGKVATAIQHVMSVTQEPEPGMRSGLLRAKRARLHADRRNFGDMRQAQTAPQADRASTLRTLKHVDRQLPLEPENFKFSLAQATGFENSIGFIFTKDALALRPVTSVAQVENEFLQKTPAPKMLGNIFEDAWNAIESAAEAVWREAQRIAIYIAETVTLVIEYADKVVQKVVATVKEAIDAVVHIIKMIGAFIADVIRFLMTLFDWGAILDAHRLIKKICNQQFTEAQRLLAGEKGGLLKMITGGVATPTGQIDASNPKLAGQSVSTVRANNPEAHAEAQSNGVQGKYVNNKIDDRKDDIAFKPATNLTMVERPLDQGADALATNLMSKLGGALTDPLSSFSDLYTSVKDLLAGDFKTTVTRLLETALPDFEMLGEVFAGLHAALNAPIEIPFISQLYKWITRGEQLTLLDVFCLAIAVPAHIGYAIYTKITTGDTHKLADDIRPWVEGRPKGLLAASEHVMAVHFLYTFFCAGYTIGSGILKAQRIAEPDGEWKSGGKFFAVMVSFLGLTSRTMGYFLGKNEEKWDQNELIWHSTLYGGMCLLDIHTAIDAFRPDGPPSRHWSVPIREWVIEKGKVGCSIVGAMLLYGRVTFWVAGLSKQPDLFQVRGVLQALTMCFAFADTKAVIQSGGSAVYYLIAGETLVKAAGNVMHFVAVRSDHTHD